MSFMKTHEGDFLSELSLKQPNAGLTSVRFYADDYQIYFSFNLNNTIHLAFSSVCSFIFFVYCTLFLIGYINNVIIINCLCFFTN